MFSGYLFSLSAFSQISFKNKRYKCRPKTEPISFKNGMMKSCSTSSLMLLQVNMAVYWCRNNFTNKWCFLSHKAANGANVQKFKAHKLFVCSCISFTSFYLCSWSWLLLDNHLVLFGSISESVISPSSGSLLELVIHELWKLLYDLIHNIRHII